MSSVVSPYDWSVEELLPGGGTFLRVACPRCREWQTIGRGETDFARLPAVEFRCRRGGCRLYTFLTLDGWAMAWHKGLTRKEEIL